MIVDSLDNVLRTGNNFDRLFGEYLLRIYGLYTNFTWMPFKEKDLDVPILPTHMDVTHLQMKIKKLFKQMLQKLK